MHNASLPSSAFLIFLYAKKSLQCIKIASISLNHFVIKVFKSLKQPKVDCDVTLSPVRAVLSFYILLLTNSTIVKHHLYLLRRSPRFWFRQEWIVQHFNTYLKTNFFIIYSEEKSSISFKNGNFSCNIIVSISFECIIGDTIKTKCTG